MQNEKNLPKRYNTRTVWNYTARTFLCQKIHPFLNIWPVWYLLCHSILFKGELFLACHPAWFPEMGKRVLTLLYVGSTGWKWDQPAWQVLRELVGAEREKDGREPQTTMVIVDSKSIQNADTARGKRPWCGGKSNIKLHMGVGLTGLPHIPS